MSGCSRLLFILHDAGGAALWAGTYITCGFFFAKELDRVVTYITTLANLVVLVFGVPLLIFFGWKSFLLVRMIRLLRSNQITPALLKARLDAGEKLGIVDLLRFEEDPQNVMVIPGAVRLDPLDIRRKRRIAMPSDVNLVVYCRSKNSFVSARVAAVMRKHGIKQILVLAGGLAAWQSSGFPLSARFADPEAELERLGIEVVPAWSYLSNRNK
jgi:rhodanese-related sulfurtransferase